MDIFRSMERLMAMDDATWARHANPLSGITRFTCLPLLALAVWSRVWLGWGVLIPFTAACAWTWWNPRAFPPPVTTDHWMSQAVLGERVFLTRRAEVPAHHLRAARWLTLASLPGALLMIWGLIVLWWEAAVFGTLLTILPKTWFCDRMVWLYRDAQEGRF